MIAINSPIGTPGVQALKFEATAGHDKRVVTRAPEVLTLVRHVHEFASVRTGPMLGAVHTVSADVLALDALILKKEAPLNDTPLLYWTFPADPPGEPPPLEVPV